MKWIMGASLGLAAIAALAVIANGPGRLAIPAPVTTAAQSQTRDDRGNPFASSLTVSASQKASSTSQFGTGGLRAISNSPKESEPPVPSVAPSVRNVELVNGIQPRIRRYIEDRYLDPREQAEMERLAVAQQLALLKGTQSRSNAKEVATQYSQAITCMQRLRGVDFANPNRDISTMDTAISQVSRESRELLGQLLDSKEAFAAYTLYMQNLSGQVLHGTTQISCEIRGENS